MICLTMKDLSYTWPGQDRPILDGLSLQLSQGEHLYVHGPSGSGKSSLLGLLAGILPAAPDQLNVLGLDLGKQSPLKRDRFRAAHLGVIFQQFNLLSYLSVLENVELPARMIPERRNKLDGKASAIRDEAKRLLSRLNLEELADRSVQQLSVGQQQRVAAARAMMGSPEVLLADEPSSALDEKNRDLLMQGLLELCKEHESSLVLVSHDPALAQHFEQQLELRP